MPLDINIDHEVVQERKETDILQEEWSIASDDFPRPHGGVNRKLHLALLKEKTEEIKSYYYDVYHSFMKSLLRREEKGEVIFNNIYIYAKELFEFVSSGPFTHSEQLLHEISSGQSYMNFDLLKAFIEQCGSEEDVEQMQKYSEAFAKYVKQRIFEYEPDLIGSELLRHETVMFLLDSDQSFMATDPIAFRLSLSKMLGMKYQQIILHKFEDPSK